MSNSNTAIRSIVSAATLEEGKEFLYSLQACQFGNPHDTDWSSAKNEHVDVVVCDVKESENGKPLYLVMTIGDNGGIIGVAQAPTRRQRYQEDLYCTQYMKLDAAQNPATVAKWLGFQ